jgi:DNA-binding NtrC family response regulator
VYNEGVEVTVRHGLTSVPVRSVGVEVVAGPDVGRSALGEQLAIGTAGGSTLRLTDPKVSRFHAELRPDANGIVVIDHGSSNGTFVGSTRLERGVVVPGTLLRLGDTTLRVGDAQPVQVDIASDAVATGLVGRSPVMRRLFAQVVKAANSDVSVLVDGESGTGKELVARALHDLSPRRTQPFVTIDCGSLPPSLLASELFGHERGAFTGADRAQPGAFEAAHGGTVFLDEIGELQPAVQATLLGVLERRTVKRLGSRTEVAVDVRVVAATHRELRAEVNRGGFRLDLFYRLAVVTLTVPPLRDRRDDVPALVEHFLRDAGWDQPIGALISEPAMDALSRMHFAGNVRELRNLVEAAVALGEPPPLAPPAAAPPVDANVPADLGLPYREARARVVDQFEAQYLDALLARTAGNISQAARVARMTRSHLSDLLARRRK